MRERERERGGCIGVHGWFNSDSKGQGEVTQSLLIFMSGPCLPALFCEGVCSLASRASVKS